MESTVQVVVGEMSLGIFYWSPLGPLLPIEQFLNVTACVSIVADNVHSFKFTVYPSFKGYFQRDNCAMSQNAR